MTKYYPTRNDLEKPDRMERVVKDIYDKLYKNSTSSTTASKPRRININTGEVIESK